MILVDQIPICEFAKTSLMMMIILLRGEIKAEEELEICLLVNNRIAWVFIIFFCLKNLFEVLIRLIVRGIFFMHF